MPMLLRFLAVCFATLVYLQSTPTNLAIAMVDQAGANPEKAAPNNAQVQAAAQQKKPDNPPADKKKAPPPPKTPDNPPSFLLKIVPIAPSNNAAEIEKLIGNPKPFTVKARDPRTLLIYGPTSTLTQSQRSLMERVGADITSLSVQPSKTEELEVPHYWALGDLAARAKKLNYPGITVEAAGDNKVRVTRANWITDEEYKNFTEDLMAMGSRLSAETPTSQVYFIGATEAVGALGAEKSDKSSGGKQPSWSGSSTTVTVDNSATQTVNTAPCAKPNVKPAPTDKSSADNGTPDSADSGSTASGDAANCDSTGGSAKGADDSSTKKPSVSISTLSPDLLVFGVEHPGDDADITEKKRILAALDFPRPEMIINTFSFQTSSSQSKVLTEQNRRLQVEVGRYNDEIQMALNRTWRYLQGRSADPDFFDPNFLNYLRMRFVAETANGDKGTTSNERDTTSDEQNRTSAERNRASGERNRTSGERNRTSKQHSSEAKQVSHVLILPNEKRATLDVCPADQYCLGYSFLFRPIRPTLTDMLLAVISSKDPAKEITSALKEMENTKRINDILKEDVGKKTCNYDCEQKPVDFLPCDQRDVFILRKVSAIEQHKLKEEEAKEKKKQGEGVHYAAPDMMPLSCFEEEVGSAFPADSGSNNATLLLRSALANFLFQYKISRQYPHDFSPYELNQTAQALNSQLNPLIVAFNRDLAAALRPLEDVADVTGCEYKKCDSGKNGFWFWQGHDTRFVNNGIITVRTVSGKETIVDTVTQNFFDATELPSITDLINSVGQAESNVPKVLKANLTANEAAVIIGALNSVKPSVAKVGREFKIDITPHSVSGASAAELDLKMVTGDQADPTRYSNGKSDPDNLSRVAKQTTNTKVRLESIKLFEISSFSATLQRSRKNVPIIPPLFELPYIGSVLSFPVAGGKQFHRSTAVMSAVVVPTAADLASGLEFTRDRLLVRPLTPIASAICVDEFDKNNKPIECSARPAYSPDDLRAPIWEYNRRKVLCFGMGKDFGNGNDCGSLTFKDLLPQ
jgi:hypothetical protein